MSPIPRGWHLTLFLALLLALICLQPATSQRAWEVHLSSYERQNLQANREWIIERRQAGESLTAEVAVVAGAGVWHHGAQALVKALERAGVACHVLDPLDLSDLSEYQALVLPGGFSAYQYYALGDDGCEQIANFARSGGHVLGICAGGYLVSEVVRYEGVEYPYPLALFDGTADGPVAGLPVYPAYGPCRVKVTEAGHRLGLEELSRRTLLYGSGPRFVGGTDVSVLLTYSDGTAAAIAKSVGKGQVVAIGVHMEVSAPDSDPPAGCEVFLLRLLGIVRDLRTPANP
jgi:hypothetical protein